jgi:hypothetical protein
MASSSSSISSVSGGGTAIKHTQSALVAGVTQAQLWAVVKDYIRHPEEYLGAKDVQILQDTPEFVDRKLFLPEANNTVQDRMTWSDQNMTVRATSV